MTMLKRFLLAVVLCAALFAGPSVTWAADRALSFAVSGVVAEVKVSAGANVVKGDVLAVLDLTPFRAKKRAADAAGTSTKVILDLAKRRLKQTRELFDALSTSAEQVELAETAEAKARMAYEDARAGQTLAKWELERATLKAPFDATVAATPGFVGQVVNVNAGAAAVVVVSAP